ncbi:unnamed protein product [Merluccius merluccius]
MTCGDVVPGDRPSEGVSAGGKPSLMCSINPRPAARQFSGALRGSQGPAGERVASPGGSLAAPHVRTASAGRRAATPRLGSVLGGLVYP